MEVGGCGCEVGSLFLRCLSRGLSLSLSHVEAAGDDEAHVPSRVTSVGPP